MSHLSRVSLGRFLRVGRSLGFPDSAASARGVLVMAQALSARHSVLPRLRGLGYKEEEFSWSQYLRSTRAQAAPKHLFVNQSHVSGPEQVRAYSHPLGQNPSRRELIYQCSQLTPNGRGALGRPRARGRPGYGVCPVSPPPYRRNPVLRAPTISAWALGCHCPYFLHRFALQTWG